MIDSQSVKAAETVGPPSRGYDAGKKINGRKRHIVIDTIGLLLAVLSPPPASRTATARSRCCGTRDAFPTIWLVWADGGYAGHLVTWAALAR